MIEKPFDIVWFIDEHMETAMRSLALLPQAELERRGKVHHFRLWEGAPTPREDPDIKTLFCVCTDQLGSVAINPGRRDRKTREWTAQEFYSQVIKIADGFWGGYLKPEIWQYPEFVKAAKAQEKLEQHNKEMVAKLPKPTIKSFQVSPEMALRRFFTTVGRMTMQSGAINPHMLPDEELQDIYAMALLNGVKLPTIEEWVGELVTVSEQAQKDSEVVKEEYDPVSFFEYSKKVLSVVS